MRNVAVALLATAVLACGEQPTVPDQDAAFARLDGASQGGMLFTTDLTGAEEAPGPGDPDGSGTFSMTVNPGLGTVCYEIHVQNITLPATGAHIHAAAAGSPGGVVVPLTAPDATGHSSGCVSVAEDLLLAIRKNPENYYVNVHTLPTYGAGAVRGQLGD